MGRVSITLEGDSQDVEWVQTLIRRGLSYPGRPPKIKVEWGESEGNQRHCHIGGFADVDEVDDGYPSPCEVHEDGTVTVKGWS